MSNQPRYFLFKTDIFNCTNLLKSIPVDVIPVNCNNEMNVSKFADEFKITIHDVPCVVYWRPDEEKVVDANGSEKVIEPHWAVYYFENKNKIWNWSETPY